MEFIRAHKWCKWMAFFAYVFQSFGDWLTDTEKTKSLCRIQMKPCRSHTRRKSCLPSDVIYRKPSAVKTELYAASHKLLINLWQTYASVESTKVFVERKTSMGCFSMWITHSHITCDYELWNKQDNYIFPRWVGY